MNTRILAPISSAASPAASEKIDPAVEAARQYLEAGWAVVPVEPNEKRTTIDGWPQLAAERAWTAEDFAGKNVGVVLGHVSRDLVDIDLDSALALRLAPAFLPDTLTFGRASKPRSHWLYYAPGVRSAMLFFKGSTDPKDRQLVEVRSTNASSDACGHQSVFPGSTHESGERVEWCAEGPDEPQAVEAGALVWAVNRLVVACCLLRDWHEGSGRRTKALCVSSGLLAQGWTAGEVRELFEAVEEAAGDSDAERRDYLHQVETTIEAFEAGRETQGYGTLVAEGIFDAAQIKELERHARTPEARLREVKLAMTGAGAGARARMVAEARAVDGIASAADIVAAAACAAAVPANETGTAEGGESAELSDAEDDAQEIGALADLARDPEPLHYVCEGLAIAPGKISSLAGYAGIGKGPLINLLALCVASGKPFLGHRTRRCNVLICDFETGPIVETRLKRLARALGIDLSELQASGALKLRHCGGKAIDEKWIAKVGVDARSKQFGMICVDSYTSAVAAEQNDAEYSHAAFALGAISHAQDLAIVANVHHRKTQPGARGASLEMVSGHNAFAAAMQTVVSISRPDEDDDCLIELQCARAPEEPFKPVRFRWENVTNPAANPAASPTPGGRLWGDKWGLRAVLVEASGRAKDRAQRDRDAKIEAAVLRYVKGAGGGLSMRAIQKQVAGSESAIKAVVLELAEKGKLAAHTTTRGNGDQHTTYSAVA